MTPFDDQVILALYCWERLDTDKDPFERLTEALKRTPDQLHRQLERMSEAGLISFGFTLLTPPQPRLAYQGVQRARELLAGKEEATYHKMYELFWKANTGQRPDRDGLVRVGAQEIAASGSDVAYVSSLGGSHDNTGGRRRPIGNMGSHDK